MQNDHGIFKKLFGPEAKNYTKYRTDYPKELFDLLTKLLPNKSGKILDIACGTGKSTEALVETGLSVTGCDHDEQMINEAKDQAKIKNLNIEYIVSEAEKLPFPDQHFDVVTVGTAFHFFVTDLAMSEIKRVLKPNGLFFVYWTLTTKDTPDEDEIPGSIFRKYNWIKIPPVLRDLKNISEFLNKSGLQNVSTVSIPVIYNTTVEERVGLMTTSGTYELLSTEEKNNFLEDIRSVLTEKLGKREYFTLEEEIQVCYGFVGDFK